MQQRYIGFESQLFFHFVLEGRKVPGVFNDTGQLCILSKRYRIHEP